MRIGYCRVSSREQAVNSDALAQQVARVKPYCDEIIEDIESGSSRDRPGFRVLMERVEAGQCKEIICTRIDRLTRSLAHLQKVLEHCEGRAVIRCLDDDFDLGTATGRFHANIIGSVAQMEAEMLSERVRHGWAYTRKQNRTHAAPFGYRLEDNKLVLDHSPFLCELATGETLSRYQCARIVVMAFIAPGLDDRGRNRRSLRRCLQIINERFGVQAFNQGRGKRAAGRFGFSLGGLSTWLRNPNVRGHLTYLRKRKGKQRKPEDWEIYPNTHEALITEEEGKIIDEILLGNRNQAFDQRRQIFPMSGLIRCDRCRSVCYLQSGTRGKTPGYNYYYQCPKYLVRACENKRMVREPVCRSAVIDALVGQAEQLADRAIYDTSMIGQPEDPQIRELESSLAALEALPFNAAIEQSKHELRNQIANLKAAAVSESQAAMERGALLQELRGRGFWEQLSNEDLRHLARMFIASVWMDEGEIVRIDFR